MKRHEEQALTHLGGIEFGDQLKVVVDNSRQYRLGGDVNNDVTWLAQQAQDGLGSRGPNSPISGICYLKLCFSSLGHLALQEHQCRKLFARTLHAGNWLPRIYALGNLVNRDYPPPSSEQRRFP